MYDNEPTMMGQGRPAATLVVRQGSQAGMSFSISGNQAIIGREEGLDIILQDAEASRRHSRISWQAGQFVIEDLGSTNGTFVNGIQIAGPQVLNPGDSIGIGQTALVFQAAGIPQPRAYPQYEAPSPPPVSSRTSGTANQESKTTQYLLYGCGCLLLIGICILLAMAAAVLLMPSLVEDVTGLDISFNLIETYLNLA
ncbi:MAG: FHA domain-containing protein [Anaerolineae bacterium]|nr:FHA domain-containing protein [Anaerolineae bacterium]